MVCRRVRCWSAARRASASCCVMSEKERVRPTSSSLPASTSLGVRSPAATWRMPLASMSSGVASCLPSSTASSTAPNTARNRLSVSVPMYMRRSAPWPSARSWYSRLASCTASASATSALGSGCTACTKRCSSTRLTPGALTSTSALMRALPPGSSSPSTCVATPCARAVRSCWAAGRSGLISKCAPPALPTMRSGLPPHREMSVAPVCS